MFLIKNNMKLIDQVKPEVLDALAESKIEFSSSYKRIILSLESVDRYKQLTIDDIQTLICFLPDEFKPQGDIDWYYGDNILQEKYKL
tara:strand:+ start:254 stop:514 length:261 start_codon:yes stop_codon:yes gene_type:complete